MQSPIHEGYEYQDYFTVSIILQLMLKQTDAEIIIDRKDFSGDKFDDLKVKTPNGTTEFQIKYSDDEYSHKLAKDDFANGNGHDTALCDLFASWKTRKESENDTQIKLCLAWNRPDDDDPIVEFLKPIQEQALPFSIVAYSFDGEVFWPVGNLPPKTWRKFNLAVKSGLIDREAFLSFCNELTIILEMPKASLDLKNPGGIENVIIRQAEKLGVGIYPNDNLNLEEVIYKLATEVKRSRAMGNRLYINTLMGRLGFIRDYGKFDQRFPVDSAHKVMLDDEIESLHRAIRDSKRVIITGNPGSGKSWLVDEYIDKLENDDSKVIHYNCFQSLQDTNSLERIRVKMAELCAHTEQMNSKIICESVITNLELLLQDTEVFKGEPRTCDLYFLQNELTRSYEQAIELIVQNGTVDDLEKALSILERLDDETGTSLDHTMGGPLTDAEFLEVISRFLTINNYEIVKPYLLRTQEKIEKNEVYDCIAAAKLRFVSLISKYNQTEALEAIKMLLHRQICNIFRMDGNWRMKKHRNCITAEKVHLSIWWIWFERILCRENMR